MDDLISRQDAIDAVTAWLRKALNPLNRSKYNAGEVAAYETALSELKEIPSAHPEVTEEAVKEYCRKRCLCIVDGALLEKYTSAQPERLTDDDFETIRIHLNACKEKLCNQHRWKEAEEYQRIIDRFMGFASAQPTIEPRRGKWIFNQKRGTMKIWTCSECGWNDIGQFNFCSNCGADMREVTE